MNHAEESLENIELAILALSRKVDLLTKENGMDEKIEKLDFVISALTKDIETLVEEHNNLKKEVLDLKFFIAKLRADIKM